MDIQSWRGKEKTTCLLSACLSVFRSFLPSFLRRTVLGRSAAICRASFKNQTAVPYSVVRWRCPRAEFSPLPSRLSTRFYSRLPVAPFQLMDRERGWMDRRSDGYISQYRTTLHIFLKINSFELRRRVDHCG